MSAPEPPPAGIAAFHVVFPVQQAKSESLSAAFVSHPHAMAVSEGWSVEVAPAMGTSFRRLHGTAVRCAATPAAAAPALPPIRMPRFELAAMGGIQEYVEPAAFVAPPACETPMRVPAAEPAERFFDFAYADLGPAVPQLRTSRIEFATASVRPPLCDSPMRVPAAEPAERFLAVASAGVLRTVAPLRVPRLELAAIGEIHDAAERIESVGPPLCDSPMRVPAAEPAERFLAIACAGALPAVAPLRLPAADGVLLAPTFLPFVDEFAPTPRPEPAASGVFAILDSRPAPYPWTPSMLRFSVHAIDDLSARAPARAESPRQAGFVTAPEPVSVESMPSVPAFAVAALPLEPRSVLPTVRCLTAQVLPQARAVAGSQPTPVETMPSAGEVRIAPTTMRSALRMPSLARFRPATDAADLLASPAAAPPPAAVESMPSAAAFAAKPLELAPRVVARAFMPRLRAELPVPVVPLPAPRAVEPPLPFVRTASLEPLARIAAQPEGAQPERPAPAIPTPVFIPLEYHSQRISSAPAKRLDAIEPNIALRQQEWAVRPLFNRLAGANKKRLVLPFEQIFAKPGDANSKRVNISLAGKIAATVMVGVALWGGSRVANLSQHTEQLRAEVAASERTVTVAETRDPNGNFGKGPVGNLRRKIADRAATEITDSFKAGMNAWGAQPKTLAAGWKKHAEGYVSVGDMALFQPSLQYTDYRMEFYGQIEDKSMSWVVRAQDRKNYYAMQFKVIEPGLRPIIAMVHYGVVNGKPGHKIETPLSVMVHNNQPYHVAVDVQGNHFSASIEGETVESWTEDTLPRGGVGFFADAGEKARLYWMRISRNQDWLGRVCAYLSGDGRSRQQTAELWAPEIPHQKPEPVHPRGADPVLAAALDETNSQGRAKSARQRRNEPWIC